MMKATTHPTPLHRLRSIAPMCVGVLLAAGCAGAAAQGVPVLEVSVTEGDGTYSFELPDEVEAGPTRFHFVNGGAEPHHVQLFRLEADATVDELTAVLEAGDPAAALELGSFQGGTGLVAPGGESRADAVVDLTVGTYAVICFVPGPDGTPHLAHGMLQPLQVTEAGGRVRPTVGDHLVELVDYGFGVPEELAGDAVLEVTNQGQAEPHEMIFSRLDGGATMEQVVGAIEQGQPVPGVPVGGVQAILPGSSQHVQLDLEPGEYVVWCVVPSPDGVPHALKGMIRTVTVGEGGQP